MNAQLAGLMAAVEDELSAYYAFPLHAAAAGHLISREDLAEALGGRAEQEPQWQARASVWLVPEGDSAFIGINLDPSLARDLADADPRDALDNRNLDPFCILIEELSHFHLLLNRMVSGRPVTRSELECQGELDKLLICAKTLKRQSGDYHVVPLARVLYDRARIVDADPEPYLKATKFAARFWFRQSADGPDDGRVRERLQAIYHAEWAEKLRVG